MKRNCKIFHIDGYHHVGYSRRTISMPLALKGVFMAEFNRAVEHVSDSRRGEEETTNNRLRTRVVAGLAAVGLSATAFFNMAPANADEVVIWGGLGDQTGEGYENQLRATGQIGPNDTVHRVPYSASIGPIGPVPYDQSINEGVANGRPILDHAYAVASPGEKVVIRGYSAGGAPAAISAAERSGGGPVAPGTVIIDSAPVSSTGLFASQDPLVQMGLGIANGMGIPTHYRAPAGSEVRGSEQDAWAYGAQANGIGELIPMAMDTFMGPAHAVQNPHVPGARVWVGPDGITQVQYPGVGTGGIPPNAITMGGPGAVAPGVAPAPEARPAPNSPNFTAVSREWKRNHPERYPEFAAQEAERQESRQDNSRTVTTRSSRGGTNKQTTSYSQKFEPPVKAPQATRLNK